MAAIQSPLLVFSYNVCNLPREVTSGTSGSLTYTYLSDGTKVSAIKSDGSGERYIGSFVYTVPSSGSETLESAAWDEGRISFTKSGSTYTKTDMWFVKDHVGNVRTVVNITPGLSAPQVVERNDYLPFGTRMNAGTAVLASNRFRLGGKESQTFGSLDLGKVDFGARMYDPFIACNERVVHSGAEIHFAQVKTAEGLAFLATQTEAVRGKHGGAGVHPGAERKIVIPFDYLWST